MKAASSLKAELRDLSVTPRENVQERITERGRERERVEERTVNPFLSSRNEASKESLLRFAKRT